MFLHNSTYYLWVSGTMGWSPTTMFLYSAIAPLGAFANSSDPGHGWHSYTKGIAGNSSSWNSTWTVRDGYLATGSVWGAKGPKRNLTLPSAKALCAAAADCAGFTFNDYDSAPPPGKLLAVSLKTAVHFVAEDREIGLQPPPIPVPGTPGNSKPAQPGQWAFDSQSTYILPNPHHKPGSKIAPFIYMGDRWNFSSTLGTSTATYIWLPLFIDPLNPRSVRVVWADEWALDDAHLSPF